MEATNQQVTEELAATRQALEQKTRELEECCQNRRSQPPDSASLLNLLRREVPKGKASLKEVEVLLKILGNLGE